MATYYFRNVGTDWNTASNWSLTDGGAATGAVPTAADDAYFTSNSGNCTISTASRVCLTLVFSGVGAGNYSGTFTLNNTLTVSGNITLSSSMTFSGTSTITINANSTITTNTKVFPCNITISGARTITLGDDVYVTGNISTAGAVGNVVTFNSNTLYVSGNFGTGVAGMNIVNNSNVTMNGTGTFSVANAFGASISGTGIISFNTDGVITLNTTMISCGASGKTLQYVKGSVVLPRGQSLVLQATGSGIFSLDLKGVQIKGAITFATQGSFSLISDFIVDGGSFTFGGGTLSGSQPLVINSNGGNLYLGDNELPSSISTGTSNMTSISGTVTIYIKGNGSCTFSQYISISSNIVFDFTGIVTFANGSLLGTEQPALSLQTGTFTFLNGRISSRNFAGVKNQGLIAITTSTLIGFDKFSGVGNIRINNTATLTMDKFFSGRPDCISNIFCNSTTGSYTITFQDNNEKVANWIRLSNCTLTRRGQLIVLNQKAVNNTARNTGVRYQNVWPNGVPERSPTVANPPMTFGAGGILADPVFSL